MALWVSELSRAELGALVDVDAITGHYSLLVVATKGGHGVVVWICIECWLCRSTLDVRGVAQHLGFQVLEDIDELHVLFLSAGYRQVSFLLLWVSLLGLSSIDIVSIVAVEDLVILLDMRLLCMIRCCFMGTDTLLATLTTSFMLLFLS